MKDGGKSHKSIVPRKPSSNGGARRARVIPTATEGTAGESDPSETGPGAGADLPGCAASSVRIRIEDVEDLAHGGFEADEYRPGEDVVADVDLLEIRDRGHGVEVAHGEPVPGVQR